jgi:putative MATE family efflux protein
MADDDVGDDDGAPRATLTEGPVSRALAGLAVPMGFGIVFILAVNLVDTYFVAQLGTVELAAMSFTFPVVGVVMSIAMGLGIGTMSAISRAVGAGDGTATSRLTTHGILLSIGVVTVVALLGLATQGLLFRALGASDEVLPLLSRYMTIWYLGAGFLVVPMVANSVLRALGDARSPMVIMLIAAFANGILDPLLIFGAGPVPAMGLEGAAVATVISRAIALLATLYLLGVRRRLLELRPPVPAELLASTRRILSVGAPAVVTNVLTPVATAVLTAVIATQGTAAVAAYGVGSRIEGLAMIAPIAVGASLTPFIGQNWGAHRPERAGQAIRMSNAFGLAWGLGAWLLLAVGGSAVGRVFTEDPEVLALLGLYLWIVPFSWGFSGVVNVVSAAFNAIDRARRATVLSVARSLLLAVPLALLGGALGGVAGVFVGMALANVLTAALAAWWALPLTRPGAVATERVPAHEAVLRGASRRIAERLEAVIQQVAHLDGMEARVDAEELAFVSGPCELGHVHPGGEIDVALPAPLRDHLLDAGLVRSHRHGRLGPWVSLHLEEAADYERAGWLLRLVHALVRLKRHGVDDALGQAELAALKLSDTCRRRIEESLAPVAEPTPVQPPVVV